LLLAIAQNLNDILYCTIFTGTFGLPFGTFISQPVKIENGDWKPNHEFPSPDETIINDIVSKVEEIAFEYDLGKRFNINRREFLTDEIFHA